jgi:hypothetical protein
MDKIPVSFEHNGTFYEGYLNPLGGTWHVVLNSVYMGNLTYKEEGWTMDINGELAAFLGDYLIAWTQ